MQIDYTTWGGDAQQQARRQAMVDQLDRPAHWLQQGWDDLRAGMQGRGNTPERCFANCVQSLVRALERGATDIDLTCDRPPGVGGMPVEADLVQVFRAVANALELEALAVYKAQHDAHAQIEAVDSMEPVAQAG